MADALDKAHGEEWCSDLKPGNVAIIFAFGAVLHETVTARRAFGGESQARVIAVILEEKPPAIPETNVARTVGGTSMRSIEARAR